MSNTLDDVREILVDALELQQAPDDLQRDTPLFGALPELDSFGVVQLISAIEERFGITVDDDEFSAGLFETMGTLADFVDSKRAAA